MNTTLRTFTLILVLNSLFAGFVLAQVNPSETPVPSPVPTPVPQSWQDTLTDAQLAERQAASAIQSQADEIQALMENLQRPESALRFNPFVRDGRTIGANRAAVLVIPTGPIDTEELSTINEDINIMSSIIRNSLEESGIDTSARTTYGSILGQRQNALEATYLLDYGVLFSMNAGFPLSAPPDLQENREEPEDENVDTVWEQTRQQIYQPRANTTNSTRTTTTTEVEYDAQRVENLKTNLIQSLKHASNIRALQPDESVILSITGTGTSDGIVSIQNLEGTNRFSLLESTQGNLVTRIYEEGLPDDAKFSAPTVLVIRAKKSDIDAFAKGQLDLEEFRQRVPVITYPLLGSAPVGVLPSLSSVRVTTSRRAPSTINSAPIVTSESGVNTTNRRPTQDSTNIPETGEITPERY